VPVVFWFPLLVILSDWRGRGSAEGDWKFVLLVNWVVGCMEVMSVVGGIEWLRVVKGLTLQESLAVGVVEFVGREGK
jgi:hypothetical protein